jgi:hypothetical protein
MGHSRPQEKGALLQKATDPLDQRYEYVSVRQTRSTNLGVTPLPPGTSDTKLRNAASKSPSKYLGSSLKEETWTPYHPRGHGAGVHSGRHCIAPTFEWRKRLSDSYLLNVDFRVYVLNIP